MLELKPPVTRVGERYFAILFSYDSEPKRAKFSHTFASVVRATGQTPILSSWRLEVHSISWLPATLQVNVWRLRPEPGVNLKLRQTLEIARDGQLRIKQWGPFEIRSSTYWRFLARVSALESGEFQYQAVDPLHRKSNVTDCIHAISDLDLLRERWRYMWIRFGDLATEHLVCMMHRNQSTIESGLDLFWMNHRLQLHGFPIAQQPYTPRFTPSKSAKVLRALAIPPKVLSEVPSPDFVVPPKGH